MSKRASAVKSEKQSKKRHKQNKSIKSRLHTETTKFERAIERGDIEEAEDKLNLVTKLLHQAVSKSVMHKNTAGRRQAKLQKMLNAAAEEEAE